MNLFIDGRAATADDLAHQALVNYGAYTSFRVEDGGTRGLGLHLARLEAAAVELFGESPGEARLRDLMRGALDRRGEAWLRVSLFAPEIGHRDPTWVGTPRVMVAVSDPPAPLGSAIRVRTQVYAREWPKLKHGATFGLMRARRAARAAGFDDALFVDADGRVSEGTLWNVGFVRGETVVWPEAPMLEGVAQTLIRRGLEAPQTVEPVRVEDLAGFDGAFLSNSATPACAITAIDGQAYPADELSMDRLRAAWARNPVEVI